MMRFTDEWLRQLPKVELHVHLEGTLNAEQIIYLAEKTNIDLPKPQEELFTTRGLAEFLELLDWICSLVRSYDDVKQIAYNYADYARQQGIVYAEVMTNPSHWKNIAMEDLVNGILDGFDEAAGDGHADCRLLVSLLRTQSPVSAGATVDWICEKQHSRLIGLSVDGNEAAAPDSNKWLANLFARAKCAGLGITAHAGESSGPEGVREALDILGVSRIDHGVRAIEDHVLMERIIKDQIPLTVCHTSNVLSGLFTTENHPLCRMYDMDTLVTINTDDPELFRITLIEELKHLADLYGWGKSDLIKLQRNAITGSFCRDAEKSKLFGMLDAFENK
ncbi:MAG TPA: adenosine deaminase [Clostridia bacterium]|nr:adenosine deaminase [Clostridia bacterium]